jgi:pilus assembly protein Flp/PilA
MLACLSDTCRRFWRDEKGATAIEYGLIAAGIAVAIVTTVLAIGPRLDATFQQVLNALPGGTTTTNPNNQTTPP